MNGLNWNTFAILLIVCHMSTAAPTNGVRVKRDDEVSLDPTNNESTVAENDREKRKLPEAAFQSKNAVLGFVFGKIDQFIDAKTRVIDQWERSNVEKNIQQGIPKPQPVPSFQALISGVISPKISALTQTIGSLSGSVLGGSSGSSSGFLGGSKSAAFGVTATDDGSGGSAAGTGSGGGLSGILSSVLRLSGPILSASIGGGASLSGGSSASESTTEGFDDDF